MSDHPVIHPVILCGGSGTRLWPLSRKSYPKQFAPLFGESSLFQSTAIRFDSPGFARPTIVTSERFRFIVCDQMTDAGILAERVLVEPKGRNTGPAALAAAIAIVEEDPDAILLIAPADHLILDDCLLRETVKRAVPDAEAGRIVTFGVTPTSAECGYGYLRLSPDDRDTGNEPRRVEEFIEKPNLISAQRMISSGDCLWNSGIFLVRADILISAFNAHAPEISVKVRRAWAGASPDQGFIRLDTVPWIGLPEISLDYAIMEKSNNLSVLPFDGRWSDLGAWHAVWMEAGPDASGNVTGGSATAIDCRGSLLRSEADGLELVGLGLIDMIAVAMPDAVLVAPRSEGQRVREAVDALRKKKAAQADQTSRDHRPWGWFECLARGDRFQVKRIVVKPGGVLSLQSHHNRAEHWIVVAGTAKVTVGKNTRLVTENQSVYIPLGAIHRMENPGKVNMILIEVQTGAYLGEDDIIRLEDAYARS